MKERALASVLALGFVCEMAYAQPRPPPPGPPPNAGRGIVYQAETVRSLPPGAATIRFNSTPYYFTGGKFYSKMGSEYVRTTPPVGLRVNQLPPGAVMVPGSRQRQYTFDGVTYKKFGTRWEVIGGG
ncbi:MAG: DUF6515 family protein [Pseudomonadota bacterium]